MICMPCTIQPSIIYTTYALRVAEKLDPIPADFRRELGYTLGRLQGQDRNEYTFTPRKFRIASLYSLHVTDLWEETR